MSDKPYLKKCSNHFPPQLTAHWLCAHGVEKALDANGKEVSRRVHHPAPGKEVTALDGRRYKMTVQGNLVRLS